MTKAHFLPQVYLKGFSPDNKSVFQTNINYGNSRLRNLEQVGYLPDLYSFIDDNDVKHDKVENPLLSTFIEKGYDDVIQKLENKIQLNNVDLELLFVFLSFLVNRIPRQKIFINKLLTESTFAHIRGIAKYNPEELREMYKKYIIRNKDLQSYSWNEFIDIIKNISTDQFVIDDNKLKYEFIMFMLGTSKELYFLMRTLKRRFIFSDSDFITSDFPYFIVNSEGGGKGFLNGDTYFPLSSKVCMIISRNPHLHKLNLNQINQEIINASDRYIFSEKQIDISSYLNNRKETMRTNLEFDENFTGLSLKVKQY